VQITSEYTDDWRLINKLTVRWPYSQQEIYTALESEEFVGNGRAYCNDLKSPILKNMLANASNEAVRLLAEMCEQQQFKEDTWHLESTEQMLNNVSTLCCFVCDHPGYNTDIHIDSRMTVCAGMFFFNSFDDENQSTTFYTSLNGDNPIRLSSEYGTGWYAANTQMNWHQGGNNTLRDRYAIMFINKLNLK
jgi:hypothetical protein